MIYRDFQGKKLSLLGFGTMRLPVTSEGVIDESQVQEMTELAIKNGVNYFDTAYPYHAGESERVIGKILSNYPRDSFYLATKFPGHQILSNGYHPAEIFETQLKKCKVDYFDFYLLHNVYEKSIETYLDPKWGIIEYFKEQKRLGRIRHLGFSCHARTAGLEQFLAAAGKDMEFCQIQMNYLDWTLQDAKGKYELLTSLGIPVWVMEPVRGGRLANLSSFEERPLKELNPKASAASWGFRFLQQFSNVKMILSGMSNKEQMLDNINTFSKLQPVTSQENQLLLSLAKNMKDSLPCTACRYCCDSCPLELDIPMLLATYNELKFSPNINAAMPIQFMEKEKQPSACIGCGSCTRLCPQNIDIPKALKDLSISLEQIPSWVEISKQREEEAKKIVL